MTGVAPVLLAGAWGPSREQLGTVGATNPATREPLPERYPVSGRADVIAALAAGHEAAQALRNAEPERIADCLERFAELIEAHRQDLIALARLETGLPEEPRLGSVELPRTTDQLRQAARAVRERSWTRPVIDTGANIRSLYASLGGPVVVFGPNNFPLAFNGVSGGDFAAALAAGNTVIAKANPGHPGTTRRLAELASKAVVDAGLPGATVQLLYHLPPELGLELVSHPLVAATGFTGSRRAGLALKEAADRAGKPIYLELSSTNPVFILSGALKERAQAIADDLLTSSTLGAGQFCTSPGLVVLPSGEPGKAFERTLVERFTRAEPGVLLGEGVFEGLGSAVGVLQELGAQVLTGTAAADGAGFSYAAGLLRVTGKQFLANPGGLQTEAFGPVSLLVVADEAQLPEVAKHLEGGLTGTVYSHTAGEDEALYNRLEPILRQKVGRLLNDKMPTGVAVSPAMNHGGPYPATGHPGFTAVGLPAAIGRFAALYCYDNVRPHRLPPELRDENPQRIWRSIDGAWSREDVRQKPYDPR